MAPRKNVLLRLDPVVHDALARWAADELRSVNAQIEYALRLALKQVGREPGGREGSGSADAGREDVGDGGEAREVPGEEAG